jgi:hypothetical protein
VNEKQSFKLKYQSPTNKDKIYLRQDLNWQQNCCCRQRPKRRYWVTGDGLAETALQNTILVIEMRCLDIRAEP